MKLSDFEKAFISKSIEWEYEGEVRLLLHENKSCEIKIRPEVYKGIFLGLKMTNEHKSEIIKIVKSWPAKIEVYQAINQIDTYEKKFEKIIL